MRVVIALLLSSVLAAQQAQPNSLWSTLLPNTPTSQTETVTIPQEGGFVIVEVSGVPNGDFVLTATPGVVVPNSGWCSGWFVMMPETIILDIGQIPLSGTMLVWFQVAPIHPILLTVQAAVDCPGEFLPSPPGCAVGDYEPVPSQCLIFSR